MGVVEINIYMGLFGTSKFEQAQRYIDDVEVFYERMVAIFKKNINTRYLGAERSHSSWTFNHICDDIDIYGRKTKDEYFFKDVDSLFSNYPAPIAEDHEIVNKYFLQQLGNLNHYNRPKYMFPSAIHTDANWRKSYTLLVIKPGCFLEIDKVCKDFFEMMDNAFSIVNDYRQRLFNSDYQELYLRLLPLYYRGKGAIIWFNYLNKIEE